MNDKRSAIFAKTADDIVKEVNNSHILFAEFTVISDSLSNLSSNCATLCDTLTGIKPDVCGNKCTTLLHNIYQKKNKPRRKFDLKSNDGLNKMFFS